MERQIISFIVFVLMAIAVPVLIVSGPDWWHRLASALSAGPAQEAPKGREGTSPSAGEPAGTGEGADSLSHIGKTPLRWEQIFRFDITPEEIVRLFPRVSVGLGTLHLQGYRVPVVTGTRPEDLAGSLTYYFNSRGQVELIEFVGTTGAAGPIAAFCHRQFGLAHRITNSPGVYMYERPHHRLRRQSQLVIRPSPVLQAGEEFGRFWVELRLFREAAEDLTGSPAPLLPTAGRSL